MLLLELRCAFCACACAIILVMLLGVEERVMTVVTPADVASLAATILVDMPPVPRLEPALETGAFQHKHKMAFWGEIGAGNKPSTASEVMSSTTSMACASGWVRGFLS